MLYIDEQLKLYDMTDSIKERIGDTIVGIMVLIVFIFVGGLCFGAGRIDWWCYGILISEVVLMVVVIVLSIFL